MPCDKKDSCRSIRAFKGQRDRARKETIRFQNALEELFQHNEKLKENLVTIHIKKDRLEQIVKKLTKEKSNLKRSATYWKKRAQGAEDKLNSL